MTIGQSIKVIIDSIIMKNIRSQILCMINLMMRRLWVRIHEQILDIKSGSLGEKLEWTSRKTRNLNINENEIWKKLE